ncbi:MAG: hypothetical protein HZB38_01210, partial [Planctomycetes bacterium]|nr:hypothetical protein [Planctomycetota bacterium]
IALVILFNLFAQIPTTGAEGQIVYKPIAWPWLGPIGSVIAFVWGYALAGRKAATAVARD